MKKTTTNDMTQGAPLPIILRFTLPLLMGTLFQQVYNIADTMIVGQILGVDALAAVGAIGGIHFLIFGFCIGTCSGFAIPIAQQFGAKNYPLLKKYVGNAMTLSAVISLVLTAVTMILCRQILIWSRTPENIFEMTYSYLIIIFAGIPATVLYNLLAGYLRSLGDSKRPLYFLVISSLLNIVLDLVFILSFHWGVAGAALATVLAQAVSGVMCLVYINRKVTLLHMERSDYVLDRDCSWRLIAMGMPMGFQYSITAIGSVLVQTAVNGLGSVSVAAMTAATKFDMFGQCPIQAISNAMASYAGQNVGAERYDRVRTGLKDSCIMGTVYSLLLLLAFYLIGDKVFWLFVDRSQTEVIAQGYQCIMIYLLFFVPLAWLNIIRFTIQGMGFSSFAMYAGVAEMFARSAVALFFVPIYGFLAACFAGPMAWIAANVFLIPAFFYCIHKLERT